MIVTRYHDTIHVSASAEELEEYEASVAGGPVGFTYVLREYEGEARVCEAIRYPTDLAAFPRMILSEALAAYAQGFIDGQAQPHKPLWQFSSIHMARGPYYDNGVCMGQETAHRPHGKLQADQATQPRSEP